jgi:chemotaxis protein CheZ
MPSKFTQSLTRQFERVRADKGDQAAIEHIAKMVEGELLKLISYIEKTKVEVASLAGEEPATEHLAKAKSELDAIVAHTAEATGTILDAADELEKVAQTLPDQAAQTVRAVTTKIYEASTFQDITAQRIMKIAAALQQVEDTLGRLLGGGAKAKAAAPKKKEKSAAEKTDADLLHGPQLPGDAKTQDEIDALFEKD